MRRSMQLPELESLFAAVPEAAGITAYRRAVLDENVLGQASTSGRLNCWKPLRSLYRLDPKYLPFKALRRLWGTDHATQRRLALLAAIAHDPLLRSTSETVVEATPGSTVSSRDLALAVERRWPGRFGHSGLQKIGQYTSATWRQAGLLDENRVREPRATDVPVRAAAYAFLLAGLAGFSGAALLRSPWTALLELSPAQAELLATRARTEGLIDYRTMGGIVEFGFAPLRVGPT
jgi:hypothetical protein